jgi:hypothetical protein
MPNDPAAPIALLMPAAASSWSMISRDFSSGFSDIWRTPAGIIHTSHDLFIP